MAFGLVKSSWTKNWNFRHETFAHKWLFPKSSLHHVAPGCFAEIDVFVNAKRALRKLALYKRIFQSGTSAATFERYVTLQFYFQACLFFRRYYFHSWVSNHISCPQWTLLNCKPVQCKSLKKPAKSIQFPLAFKRFVAVLSCIKSPLLLFRQGGILPKKNCAFSFQSLLILYWSQLLSKSAYQTLSNFHIRASIAVDCQQALGGNYRWIREREVGIQEISNQTKRARRGEASILPQKEKFFWRALFLLCCLICVRQ